MALDIVGLRVQGIPETKMEVYPAGDLISDTIRQTGCWDTIITEFMRRWLTLGSVMIDVGANIGYNSIISSRFVGPMGSVYSFEPHPNNFEVLTRNLGINEIRNAKAYKVGVSHIPGKSKLLVSNTNSGGHSAINFHNLPYSLGEHDRESYTKNVEMELVKIDDFLPKAHNFSGHVDLLKIDTEGYDVSAIISASEIIKQNNGRIAIIMELWPSAIALSNSPVDKFFELICENNFDAWISMDGASMRPTNTSQLSNIILANSTTSALINVFLTPALKRMRDNRIF